MNPWWESDRWYERDYDYYERVRKSPFIHRWFWILNRATRQLIISEGSYDILVLAGPRRTGKTSLVKKLIEQNYDDIKSNSIYMALDDYSLQKAIRNLGLKDILLSIIEELDIKEPLIIIIDEASALTNWDLHIKNVIDSFTSQGKKFLLLVTGSLGLRLLRGSTNILGRRGDIPYLRNIANPGVILPYKFSEYAEALGRVRMLVRFLNLLKKEEREKTLLNLTKPEVLDSNIRKLQILHSQLGDQLEKLFNTYLISGGYPLIVYELIIKNELKRLDAKWYREFAGILLQDLKYTRLRSDIAQYVLGYLREINKMSPLLDLDKLEGYIRARANLSKRDLQKFRIEEYIEYFNDTFILIKASEIAQITEGENITRNVKLFIVDPFIFHSIMFGDYSDPLIESRKLLKKPSQAGTLVEHAVSAHFLRLATKPTLYYHIRKEEDKTVGELDCICSHRNAYIPVEVKYIENEEKLIKEAEDTSRLLHALKIGSRPIIISKNTFEIEPNYVIIPAHIFLLLF